MPDAAALLLRIGDAGQLLQETLAGVHHPEIDAEVPPEGLFDLVPLVQPEQSMIDEDAGEPVADGAVDQDGRHRGVHPARQPADHPRGRARPSRWIRATSLSTKWPGGPVGRAAADLEEESC